MTAPAAARTGTALAGSPAVAELPAPPAVAESPVAFDPDRGWQLHPQVAVRPEPFGALLYHFGTRKLSFLKNRTIVEVVKSLAEHPDVRSACRAAGIADDQQAPYLHAFGVLAQSTMLVPKENQ
jgi:mycofactocin biosynthesis protein MftB